MEEPLDVLAILGYGCGTGDERKGEVLSRYGDLLSCNLDGGND